MAKGLNCANITRRSRTAWCSRRHVCRGSVLKFFLPVPYPDLNTRGHVFKRRDLCCVICGKTTLSSKFHKSPVTSHQSRVYSSPLPQPLFVPAGGGVAGRDYRGGGRTEDAGRGTDGHEWYVGGGGFLSSSPKGEGHPNCWTTN